MYHIHQTVLQSSILATTQAILTQTQMHHFHRQSLRKRTPVLHQSESSEKYRLVQCRLISGGRMNVATTLHATVRSVRRSVGDINRTSLQQEQQHNDSRLTSHYNFISLMSGIE